MKGILIHGEGNVNFDALAADGIRFAVLSASAGQDRCTPHLAQTASSARRAGIGVAVYHRLKGASVTEALSEANHFRRILAEMDSPPLWAICRAESPLTRDPHLLLSLVRAFLERVRSAGYRPMLYTTEEYLKRLPAPLPYPLCLARWSVPEAQALARNPLLWEYGEGKAGDLPRVPLLRGYSHILRENLPPMPRREVFRLFHNAALIQPGCKARRLFGSFRKTRHPNQFSAPPETDASKYKESAKFTWPSPFTSATDAPSSERG